jgi:hypothetical protein
MRWDTKDIHSIHQEECKSILTKEEMMQKMGTLVSYGGFSLTNLKFKTWLHLKMLINSEVLLINSSRPPPVNCNGQEKDMSAFPIQQPHKEDLCIDCHFD